MKRTFEGDASDEEAEQQHKMANQAGAIMVRQNMIPYYQGQIQRLEWQKAMRPHMAPIHDAEIQRIRTAYQHMHHFI